MMNFQQNSTVHDAEVDYLDLIETFRDVDLLLVGIHCPLDELERRKRGRGKRHIGLARQQSAIL